MAIEVSFNKLSGLSTAAHLADLEHCYLQAVADEYCHLRPEGEEGLVSLSDVFVMLQALRSERKTPAERRPDMPSTPQRAEHTRLVNKQPRRKQEDAHPKPPRESKETCPEPSRELEEESLPLAVPLSAALKEQRHLALLGEPGAGKSTTLQFIALCFAQESWALERLDLDEDRVPVWLSLQEAAARVKEERLETSLSDAVARLGRLDPGQAQQLVIGWWKAGRLVVLLDGLDEVPEETRPAVADEICRFARTPEGRGCRVIVASRLAGYRDLGQPFGEHVLCSFAGLDVTRRYVAGWLAALKGILREEAAHQADDLLAQIRDQPGLSRVIDNPLLLRLVISTYVSTGEMVPNRAGLYQRYVEEVAWARALKRATPPAPRDAILEALEAIAWTLQTKGEQTFGELAEAVRVQVFGVEDARGLVDFLRQAIGLLVVYGDGSEAHLTFAHQTFREYFVAQRLKRAWKRDPEQTWLFLKPRLHHPAWREPVLLLAAMIGQKGAVELIERILQAASIYEQGLYRDLLLAGECLGSGAQVNSELRRVILDKLLQLYLREIAFETTWPRSTLQRLVVQPLETIFGSLGDDGRADIMASLLAIAKGEDKAERFAPSKVAANLALATRTFVYLILAFLYDFVKTRRVRGIREVFFFPAYLKEARSEARTFRQRAAIKAIGSLKLGAPETIPVLLGSLEDAATRDWAAEALGIVGPGTAEVVMALVDAQQQHRHVYGWDRTVDRIIEALGILGQRHPEVVELLLGIVKSPEPDPYDVRYAVTYALCKSAETDPRAMAFVLEGWRNLYRSQITPGEDIVKILDEGVREGLKDGRKLITSASPEVVRYLLDVIRDSDDWRMPNTAGEFLARVVGDTPLVQCKVVSEDSSLRYTTLDLTEELFDVFLQRPRHQIFGNVALSLLVRWGLNRPELTVRLINVVREADAWLLASILEATFESPLYFKQPVDPELRMSIERSIARLRSPEKATRDTELNGWLAVARSAPEDSWYLHHLPTAIETTKCQILHDVYASAYPGIWAAHEDSWGKQLRQQVNPYVVAALACFRGWSGHDGGLDHFHRPLTAEEVREEFLSGANQALSILQKPGKQAVEILFPILAIEDVRLTSSALEKKLKEEKEGLEELLGEELKVERWRERSKPDFRERSAAAYALAQLAGDYPEAQAVLLSTLKPHFWGKSEFQEHLIRALGYVRHANRDLVAALFEIATEHDEDVYRAGSEAIGRLQNPDPEAVPLLIQRYEELNECGRSRLLKTLGTVEPPTPEVIGLLLKALKEKDPMVRSAAATELGNLKEPSPTVIGALIASIRRTLAGAEAIGKLADRITSIGGTKMQDQLVKVAKVLWKTTRRDLPSYDFTIGRSGYDVAYEALNRVVGQLTLVEVAALPTDLPLLEEGGAIVATQARPLSPLIVIFRVLVAAILGLVVNIVAAYLLQERYQLISDPIRFAIVLAVVLASLAASVGLDLRAGKGS